MNAQSAVNSLHSMLDARIDALSGTHPYLEAEHLPALRTLLTDLRSYERLMVSEAIASAQGGVEEVEETPSAVMRRKRGASK